MPDSIEQLRRYLVIFGCPIAQVRRLVREMADHREDLKLAGLTEGLSEPDAEARADASLGDPQVLAGQMMASVRSSSWWGRHYILTFGLLPLLAYPILWCLFLILELVLVSGLGYGFDGNKVHAAAGNPHFLAACRGLDYLAIVLSSLVLCWLARRAAVKLKWMVICSLICSLAAVIFYAKFDPHLFFLNGTVDYRLHMPWFRGVFPLLATAAAWFFQRRKARRFLEHAAE